MLIEEFCAGEGVGFEILCLVNQNHNNVPLAASHEPDG